MEKLKDFWNKEKVLVTTIIVVIVLDKITKHIVKNSFYLGESRKVIGNFFRFTYIENTGIAFGLFSDWVHPLKMIVLLLLSIVALYFIITIYIKSERKWFTQISFGLILGGAFGNIFDRVAFGKVVDFLDFGIKSYRWPFFNIADSAITIGVIIFTVTTIFLKQHQEVEE